MCEDEALLHLNFLMLSCTSVRTIHIFICTYIYSLLSVLCTVLATFPDRCTLMAMYCVYCCARERDHEFKIYCNHLCARHIATRLDCLDAKCTSYILEGSRPPPLPLRTIREEPRRERESLATCLLTCLGVSTCL